MNSDRMLVLLREAIARYLTKPFEWFESLAQQHIFEENGIPSDDPAAEYCQIELEVLDRYVESGVPVLHVSLTARDGFREYGVNIFYYGDGRSHWDGKIYEFRGGVPHQICKNSDRKCD